ncbi:MAG: RidA family protein [Pigmentiphaga sp.]|uniref:RidA family protein n=1 Tax=Pigmentiphaga sp. TaxID=1977564 RepID=UPI0029AC9A17|nr:RidA family protein [Pigmentiphaga sp.]MDX3907601.1 RidA family protein [Pigmentiphaga sp.]
MSGRFPAIEHRGGQVVRRGVVQPITPAVIATGRLVFVSGQIPMIDGAPAAPDIEGQTHAAIDMIEAILADCGCGLDRVVKTTVWLVHAEDYEGFNRAYGERFPHLPPARATVVSALVPPVRVEIEAVAVLDEA